MFLRPPATAHLDPTLPLINHLPGKIVQLVAERTLGWLNRCRRLAKDRERLNRNALLVLRWTSIRLVVRKPRQETI